MISGGESSDEEPRDRRPLLDRANPSGNSHVQYGTTANGGDGSPQDDCTSPVGSNQPNANLLFGTSTRQKLTLAILCSSSISSAMFYSLLAPFFATEAKLKGATDFEIGLIFGCFPIVGFLTAPWFGRFMTTIGSKFMFVAGSMLCSGCALLFGLLEWCPGGKVFVGLCFAIRCTDAMGSAAAGTASSAIAANTFPLRISTIMGLLQAFGCAGLTLGPFFGGILYDWRGFYLPFVVCGGIFMLCCLLSLALLPPVDDEAASTEASSSVTKNQLLLLRTRSVLVVGLLVLCSQCAMGFIDVGLSLHISDIKSDIKSVYVGVIFLIPSAIVILLAPLYGYATDKHMRWRRPAMITGAVVGSLGILGLGPSPLLPFLPQKKIGMLIGSLVVSAIGWATMPLAYAEFVLAARKHNFPDNMTTQGIVSGVNSAFNSLGGFLGPIVGGLILEAIKFNWSSTCMACAILFAAIVFAIHCLFELFYPSKRLTTPLDDQQQHNI